MGSQLSTGPLSKNKDLSWRWNSRKSKATLTAQNGLLTTSAFSELLPLHRTVDAPNRRKASLDPHSPLNSKANIRSLGFVLIHLKAYCKHGDYGPIPGQGGHMATWAGGGWEKYQKSKKKILNSRFLSLYMYSSQMKSYWITLGMLV